MSQSSSSGEEDYDPSRYPQLNPDLSLPGSEKKLINVLVTGFGPFSTHKVNASWEAVKQLAKQEVAHNVNLITVELPVEYKVIQQRIPELWSKHEPQLVVHVGVSDAASEITFETIAHNNGYKATDVTGSSAPSQCYDPNNGDERLQTGFSINQLCEDVNRSGCVAMAVPSMDAGRYLCEYTFYASLCQKTSCVAFIHVPPLEKPYSPEELGHALKCSIQCMLKQLDLHHPLPLPDAETMQQVQDQIRDIDGDLVRQ